MGVDCSVCSSGGPDALRVTISQAGLRPCISQFSSGLPFPYVGFRWIATPMPKVVRCAGGKVARCADGKVARCPAFPLDGDWVIPWYKNVNSPYYECRYFLIETGVWVQVGFWQTKHDCGNYSDPTPDNTRQLAIALQLRLWGSDQMMLRIQIFVEPTWGSVMGPFDYYGSGSIVVGDVPLDCTGPWSLSAGYVFLYMGELSTPIIVQAA